MLDETGRVLDPDDVLALAVDIVLRRRKGNVVVNLTTSSAIDDIAKAQGCRVYRSPVGEANVVELMQATDAVIGGEGSSGGIIFPAVHLCRDSYTGIAFLLDRMAETGQKVSELAAALPHYHRLSGKQSFEHGVLGQLMQNLEEGFPDAKTDRSDGLKLLFEDAWIHVRSSNTEPLLRVAVEAKSEAAPQELYNESSNCCTKKIKKGDRRNYQKRGQTHLSGHALTSPFFSIALFPIAPHFGGKKFRLSPFNVIASVPFFVSVFSTVLRVLVLGEMMLTHLTAMTALTCATLALLNCHSASKSTGDNSTATCDSWRAATASAPSSLRPAQS